MQANRNLPVCRRLAHAILAATLMLLPAATHANAQNSHSNSETDSIQTIYLTNATQQNDANEIVVALRNMLNPRVKIYFVAWRNAIVMEAQPDQLVLAQKLIAELDKPRQLYRLTYTLTTLDGGKPLSTAHYSMVVADGQRTTMKQGSRIPILTSSSKGGSSTAETQYQYLDIGMNFDATVTRSTNGVWLRSKVEQSSLAPEKAAIGTSDPIVRQIVTESTSSLTAGKPQVLVSLDIPNTTHHLQIEVTADAIP